jgi:hypothetical protein
MLTYLADVLHGEDHGRSVAHEHPPVVQTSLDVHPDPVDVVAVHDLKSIYIL